MSQPKRKAKGKSATPSATTKNQPGAKSKTSEAPKQSAPTQAKPKVTSGPVPVPNRVFGPPPTASAKPSEQPLPQSGGVLLAEKPTEPISDALPSTTESVAKEPKAPPKPGAIAVRQQTVSGLTEGDKNTIASRWRMKRDDPHLIKAFEDDQYYQYLRGLSPARRLQLKQDDIPVGEKPSPAQLLDNRTGTLAAVEPEDRAQLAKSWHLAPTSEKFVAATENEEQFQYFRQLSAEQRPLVSAEHIKQRTVLGEGDWKQLRREHVWSLTDPDRSDLAGEWGLEAGSEKFQAAVANEKSYQFFKGLSAPERTVLDATHVKAAQPLSPEAWRDLRCRAFDTMTAEDREFVIAKRWGLNVKAKKPLAAMVDERHFLFFESLSADERKVISLEQVVAAAPLSESAWREARSKNIDTILPGDLPLLAQDWDMNPAGDAFLLAVSDAKALNRLALIPLANRKYLQKADLEPKGKFDLALRKGQYEKQQKKEQDSKKRGANEQAWKKLVEASRSNTQLASADLVGYKWEAEFDQTATSFDSKVSSPSVNIANQGVALEKAALANVAKERKRRDVEAAAADFAKLRYADLKEIREQVMADAKLTVADFKLRAAAKLTAQRNPTDMNTWAKWMKFKLYQAGADTPFERLTPRLGFQTHYSMELTSLRLPPQVTDTTTAEQLVDGLLIDTGKKTARVHVSLETGYKPDPTRLALPHRFWGSPISDQDLMWDDDYRWNSEHTEAEVVQALNEAYADMRQLFITRAQLILDKGGNPY